MAGPCVWLCVLWCVSVAAADTTSTLTPPTQPERCGPVVFTPLQEIALNLQELRELMQQGRISVKPSQAYPVRTIEERKTIRPRHCQDLLEDGDSGQGVRQVYPYLEKPDDPVNVYCDHTIDNGGWTVLQRRTNSSQREDFYRTWVEYQLGFGNLTGEFWTSLDDLHALTSQSRQELRVDLADYEGEERWAKYRIFHVGPAEDNYRLTVDGYTGDAGDSLSYNSGQQFTTHDADHDTSSGNCAERQQGAWWYKSCTEVNLNGHQYEGSEGPSNEGISWRQWKGRDYSLMDTALMIRPAV